ncbi:hypothetical protein [Streptomyces sp. NPDC057336]|uniref:hypothetical protein n=1 Tax=Streptomyces sp. NPDC057336 TaxID=3346102 RepID=UPI00363E2708
MLVARRTTVPLVGALLTVLAACSGSAEDKTDTSPESEVKEIRTAAQLGTLCSGFEVGHPEAARYSGEGPHRVAAFEGGYETDTDVGPGWTLQDDVKFDGLPATALTTPVSEIELLACAEGEPGDDLQRECEYLEFGWQSTPQRSYPLYSQTYTYTVYELRTGRVVDTMTRDPRGSCPARISSSGGGSGRPDRLYAQISRWTTVSALKPVVEGSAR